MTYEQINIKIDNLEKSIPNTEDGRIWRAKLLMARREYAMGLIDKSIVTDVIREIRENVRLFEYNELLTLSRTTAFKYTDNQDFLEARVEQLERQVKELSERLAKYIQQ